MLLPVGFKLNGAASEKSWRLPPRGQKMVAILDSLPKSELLTTGELSNQIGGNITAGGLSYHPQLQDYREKVDGKLLWGNRQTIADLRHQLAALEETHDESR